MHVTEGSISMVPDNAILGVFVSALLQSVFILQGALKATGISYLVALFLCDEIRRGCREERYA